MVLSSTPRIVRFFLVIFALLRFALPAGSHVIAQTRPGADSTMLSRPLVTDSLPVSGHTMTVIPDYLPKKSPWLAVGFSAVIPGAGQIYNHDYWKAPLIWGLSAYWIYEWVQLNKDYVQYRDLYYQSIAALPPSGDNQYLRIRDFYRDERDKFAWFLGALYIVNLVDAYVGAHLYDFDVTPTLSLDSRQQLFAAASIRYRF